MVHPPLFASKHPHCKEQIEALQRCHKEHPIGKFFNACEPKLLELTACFTQEKQIKRALNKEKIQREQARLLERLERQHPGGAPKHVPGYGVPPA